MIQPQMPESKNWSFHRDVENLGWLTINTPGPVNTLSREAISELEVIVTRFEALAETHFALYLTKWLNLGEGRSPRDPQWLSITFERGRPTLWQRRRLSKLGSIGSSFGDSEQYDFTSLLSSKDRKELC